MVHTGKHCISEDSLTAAEHNLFGIHIPERDTYRK